MNTNTNQADSRPVLELNDVLRERFSKGEGVVCLQEGMSETDLAAIIKYAASFGKPFTVIPAVGFVYLDGMPDADMLPQLQKLAEAQGRSDAFVPVIFPVSKEGKSCTLKALAAMVGPHEVAEYLSRVADVGLTKDQSDTVAAIFMMLPAGATLRDFLDACDAKTAAELGIPVSRIEALRPLLTALELVAKQGRYGALFENVQ